MQSATKESSMVEIADLIRDHPGTVGPLKANDGGYTLPQGDGLELIEISDETMPVLAKNGITIVGEHGTGNKVAVCAGGLKAKLQLRFHASNNNTIIVDPNARCAGNVDFVGSGHLFVCGQTDSLNLAVVFRSDNGALFIGARCSGASVNFWVEGPDRGIQVGDDCMFSWGIYVRTSDGHGVVDLKERKKINQHASVVIGPHVWIGQDALINKGVSVGGGSIIGARAIVTKNVAACTSVAGAPAKTIREGISWTRRAYPTEADLNILFAWPFAATTAASPDET